MQTSTQVSMNDVRDMASKIIEDKGFIYSLVSHYSFPNYTEDDILRLGDASGVTDWASRQVQVLNTNSEWHQMRATVHELAHIVLKHNVMVAALSSAVMEIEAETAAYAILTLFGYADSAESKRYVRSWYNSPTYDGFTEFNKARVGTAVNVIFRLMNKVPIREEAAV